MSMFIDRKDELAKLNEIASSKKAELVLIYGRRRIGKSRLLTEFASQTGALYLLADVSKNILTILSKQIKDPFVNFGNWEDFFEFIYSSKHKIIIIDEFQYLYKVNKAWPTILQRWWEKIKDTDKKIILCGSLISTIYKISMGYGSALYGRKTREIQIEPLRFEFVKGMLKGYDTEDLIRAYAVVGGIPRYIEEFDSKVSVEENVKKQILDKTAFLYNEPVNLFFEEFRDPAPYISILLAITEGYVKFNEISDVSKIQAHKLPKYLIMLERANIITKEVPVTERKMRTKITRYRVKDNFYRFWFKFVFGNKSMIEQGMQKNVLDMIRRDFNSYVGSCFEDVCKDALLRSGEYTRIGKWWHKEEEIDIVALNEINNEIVFAECKWKDEVDAEAVLSLLKEKAKLVDWKRKKEEFVIIAKSFRKKAKGAKCLDLKNLERMMGI